MIALGQAFTHAPQAVHFSSSTTGRPVAGSIEIAPLTGLSDVIVDIVETGTTLKENNLEVTETILPISARLIANKAGSNFKSEEIKRIVDALKSRKAK